MKSCNSKKHHNKLKQAKRSTSSKSFLYFTVLGVVSFVWFIIRVIPKPSRISYPCQRVATANIIVFFSWLFGSFITINFFKKAILKLKASKIWIAGFFIALSILAGIITIMVTPSQEIRASVKGLVAEIFTPSEPVNQPMGSAYGIFPGRVTWAHDPEAVTYNPSVDNGFWWEDQNTNPERVENMYAQSLDAITGATATHDAWDILFRDANQRKGIGDIGYSPGDKIAIKLNLVMGLRGGMEKANHPGPSPQLLLALVKDLIEEVGVPGEKITVYDASARIPEYIMEPFINNIDQEYRNIRFVGNPKYLTGEEAERYFAAEGDLDAPILFADSTVVDVFWVKSLSEADFLINLANMKGHTMAGVTLCAKNLYGSIYIPTASPEIWTEGNYLWGFGPNNVYDSEGNIDEHVGLHKCAAVHDFYFNSNVNTLPAREFGTYNYLVDLLGHPQVRNKTVLNIVDAFYAGYQQDKISKFETFDNQYTASLFMSQDVIALESVCLDFLRSEPKNKVNVYGNVDNWLHESSQAGGPPSGIVYNPGDEITSLSSLGVHEHWNNWEEKAYTRNLGTGDGIELYKVNIDEETSISTSEKNILQTAYPNPFISETRIPFKLDNETWVKLTIYNQSGALIEILLNNKLPAGEHEITWVGTSVKDGVYFCRLFTENGYGGTMKLIKQED